MTSKKQIADFSSEIAGIPCGILIDEYNVTKPWNGSVYTVPSSYDYEGFVEIRFTILDRKGYEAQWLEEKMTSDDYDRIEKEIIEYKENY